ncbi:hypothetical protein [Prosthecobacter sp.]|uniref:hypothetical protein n=1 Tax=Prosthecobacter sp. TaxID=1965333 RepID=UPI002487167D|nr:hypothetical protein [Prosthecobacter sp.]MDI1314885.1 hypothetical protein [Prosthecobacter sp.]
MEYCLQIHALGCPEKVELSEDEFLTIKASKHKLESLFKMVEDYRIVVESYRTVEASQFEAAFSHILYSRAGYNDESETRVLLSSRIVAYLSCARYFIDSTDKTISSILSKEDVLKFKAFRSEIYDSVKEYRFIEALRNYSQHREVPIDSIHFHSGYENKNDRSKSDIVNVLSIGTHKASLAADPKFKKMALDGMPEIINLVQAIRCHMEGLWGIHDYLNKCTDSIAQSSRFVIESAISRFEKEIKADSLGLYAFAQLSEVEVKDKVPMLLDWDDARKLAIQSMCPLKDLGRTYVTSKARPLTP